ncbi:LysR family transcriptional regulator [Paucibacter sp. R3-3]|uniref:LysR family transcriptional regulator n=1 Tax=Roseateles agri TaxID=3098619 RepID=A0ABU5DI32_9BURK|nr:LysR family transcriptional regulator [Paucibacter sp. R3-3]MDY0745946.1 LysR family transcriptional regulator [Paucibacter sp. R3-3]
MDRAADISLFLRVFDAGSISAAARSLDLSVAVASQRLKRLETDLGVRLFQRTTRRLHPTPEGLVLAEQGRALINDLDALTAGLREAGSGIAGTLRLTTSSTFGRLYISPLLPEFLTRHPKLKISVDLDDQQHDLVAEGFDLSIRIGALHDSSLIARRVASNRRVLCASPDYLRRHGAPASPQDLSAHQCLILMGRKGRSDQWQLTGPDGQTSTVQVDGRIDSNQGELLRDAAVAGLGIALHSIWHICDDLRAGRLQVVLPDYALPDTGIHALMPQRRLVPPRVRAFVDFMAEKLGETPSWERALT